MKLWPINPERIYVHQQFAHFGISATNLETLTLPTRIILVRKLFLYDLSILGFVESLSLEVPL